MANVRAGGRVALPFLRRAPGWLREFLFVAVIYVCYEASRGVTSTTFDIAKRNGWAILHWERAWDLAPEGLLTHGLITITPLAVAAAYFYSTMHYVITPIVLVWMFVKHPVQYRPARTALAISTVLGLIGFYLLPTAPPRLLAKAGVPDTLFHVRQFGWWGGEGSVPRGLGSLTNQFAAMPSMHVGWALWCGVLMYRYSSRRWVRWAGVVYPLITTYVVLSTGNHYLLDAVAGAVVIALGFGLTIALRRGARALLGLRHHAAESAGDQPATARSQRPVSLYGAFPSPGLDDADGELDALHSDDGGVSASGRHPG